MNKVVTADEMKQIDRTAIEKKGIPELLLMENAGRSVAESVYDQNKKIKHKKDVLVFSGKGNNGADGLVCARYLKQFNIPVTVILFSEMCMLKGSSLIQYEICNSFGIKILPIKKTSEFKKNVSVLSPLIIVDAMFGIGFKGDISGIYKDAILFINNTQAYRISVDVPSGLDATDGSS
ncbi:MAG: NAD(P)H-hydrate epimerase, partial [Candidatus Omnitrophota bacterium]